MLTTRANKNNETMYFSVVKSTERDTIRTEILKNLSGKWTFLNFSTNGIAVGTFDNT